MSKRYIVVCLAIAALLAGAGPVLAAADLAAALDYLQTQQNDDGGFAGGMSPESSLSSTADAVLAIVAAGGDAASYTQGDNSPATYLAAQAPAATSGGDLAKLVMAAVALGENPRTLGGVDSVARLETLAGTDGKIGGGTDTFFSHLLAVLALASARRPIAPAAVSLIESAQQEGGGWAWDGSAATPADTNSTALAVQALVAAGGAPGGQPVAGAMAYFKAIQNEDGGWPYQNPSDFGTATDANSTAVTIQAILAAGQDPAGADWTTAGGQAPVAALEALQNDSGAFAWQATVPGDNLLATLQALPALAGKPFPVATMDVGPAAAAAQTAAPSAAPVAATDVAQSTPAAMPPSGGAGVAPALPIIVSGLGLAAAGLALRRRAA